MLSSYILRCDKSYVINTHCVDIVLYFKHGNDGQRLPLVRLVRGNNYERQQA